MTYQNRFDDIFEKKKIIPERQMLIAELDSYPEIKNVILRRRWETLVSFAAPSSSNILKEFLANADLETVDHTHTSWVRGKPVPFGSAVLHDIFQTSFNPSEGCRYTHYFNRVSPAIGPGNKKTFVEEMPALATQFKNRLANPYAPWIYRRGSQIPEKITRLDLNGDVMAWHSFVNHTIYPSTNQSDVNLDRIVLYYVLLGEENLDIGSILCDRLLRQIHLDKEASWLGHCSLVNLLCKRAGVVIPESEIDIAPVRPVGLTMVRQMYRDSSKQALALAKEAEGRAQQAAEEAMRAAGGQILYADSPVILGMQADLQHLRIQGDFQTGMLRRMCDQMRLSYADLMPPPPPQQPVPPPPPPPFAGSSQPQQPQDEPYDADDPITFLSNEGYSTFYE